MKKLISLTEVRQGQAFECYGERFVRLSENAAGAILVIREDVLPCTIPFCNDESGERNNYNGSRVNRESSKWCPPSLYKELEPRPIDLTTLDGMTDYGMPVVNVRALTVMEYQRYRRYIPPTSQSWWTATGTTTGRSPSTCSDAVYAVDYDGVVRSKYVDFFGIAPRPALYLKSDTLVFVGVDESEGSDICTKDKLQKTIMQLKSLRNHCLAFDDEDLDSVWKKDIEALDIAVRVLESREEDAR